MEGLKWTSDRKGTPIPNPFIFIENNEIDCLCQSAPQASEEERLEGEQMTEAQEWQEKAGELRVQMIDAMEAFSRDNPGIPAQIVMAALGELLIQFSVSQTGPAHTMRLLEHLREAVVKFSGKIAPQH